MTNLIVVAPFVSFAETLASTTSAAPAPAPSPIPDDWARAALWAETALAAGLGEELLGKGESPGQMSYSSAHFSLFLALLAVVAGLLVAARPAPEVDRREKAGILEQKDISGTPKNNKKGSRKRLMPLSPADAARESDFIADEDEEGLGFDDIAVEPLHPRPVQVAKEIAMEWSCDEDDKNTNTTDSSATGSLSSSGSRSRNEEIAHVHCKSSNEDEALEPLEIQRSVEVLKTIPILLIPSAAGIGDNSNSTDSTETAESCEDGVAEHDHDSFHMQDRELCLNVLCKIAELNIRLDALSPHSNVDSHMEIPPIAIVC